MPRRTRLFIGYDDNLSETVTMKNEWGAIPYPSTGFNIFRQEGDIINIDPSNLVFTWTGEPSWFKIELITNVFAGSGTNDRLDLDCVWYKNGIRSGYIRTVTINRSEYQILSGNGWIFLNTNDSLTPMVRNIANDDKFIFKNFTLAFWLDDGY